ncbi:hypothetical protein BN2476_620034 [Paraburkholderia piptadeniae]|uniref:Uncharacterized protein n=1 Tax=Paraburkholderia piptadeniae TaxID=1701573 RepID=A0A1N7SKY7_9BURK|nr:hypothetical protein BN2476_620034 [Paraburkholderia piptadeniae]
MSRLFIRDANYYESFLTTYLHALMTHSACSGRDAALANRGSPVEAFTGVRFVVKCPRMVRQSV